MRLLSLATLSLFVVLWGGCDRGSAPQPAAAPSTQPTTQARSLPSVGIPYTAAADYRPVVGHYGGRLVRSQVGEPKSFNPVASSETSTSDYTMRMFDGLTRSNAFTGELEPSLAQSWSVAEDGLTWTFKLRTDVQFNNGTPFTADDVVFTWNDLIYDLSRPDQSKEPRWPASLRDLGTFDGKIMTVQKVDDYTVRFITPVKIAILPDIVSDQSICSKQACAAAVANGSFGSLMGTEASPAQIVSTGPWMLGQYDRGKKVTLKRNPHYWRKDAAGQRLPYLDEIVFLLAQNFDTQYLQFAQGDADIYQCYRAGKDVAALRSKQEQENFKLYDLGPDPSTLFMTLNMNLDAVAQGKIPDYKVRWFRDRRFREAISYAVDRQTLVRNVYRNLGHPQYAPYSVAPGPFHVDVDPIAYDPAKSKTLLTEMGLVDRNNDGFIDDERGHKVAFTIVTNVENTTRREMVDFIVTDLRKLGMDVNQVLVQFNQLIDQLDVQKNWEAMVMGFTSLWDPHSGSNLWKSNSTNHLWWPEQKTPSFPWEKQIDDIFYLGVQELDASKRKALYADWVRLVRQEQPMIYLAVRGRVDAVRNKFGNLFPSPHPLWEFATLHNEEELFLLNDAPKAAAASR